MDERMPRRDNDDEESGETSTEVARIIGDTLTSTEVARILGVTPARVRQLDHRLSPTVDAHGVRRYRLAKVDEVTSQRLDRASMLKVIGTICGTDRATELQSKCDEYIRGVMSCLTPESVRNEIAAFARLDAEREGVERVERTDASDKELTPRDLDRARKTSGAKGAPTAAAIARVRRENADKADATITNARLAAQTSSSKPSSTPREKYVDAQKNAWVAKPVTPKHTRKKS